MRILRSRRHTVAAGSSEEQPDLTRRRFAQLVGGLSSLALIEPQIVIRALADDKRRLSWLANRTAGAEGAWTLSKIEGKVPKDLVGTLYRIAPGQSENHGVTLRHLFDGDAFVSGFSFRDGKAQLRARFVNTPQRLEEIKAGRMLYGEFGTPAPENPNGKTAGEKNQPSVNVIYWDNRLLGLSEGGHPTAIDPVTLSYQSRWDFHGTLPRDMSFTAHPKFDPVTGEGYGFGVKKGPSLALTVYRMETDGKLTELYSLPQRSFFMIHDMMLVKEHLIFVIPPVNYDLSGLLSGKATPAAALRYAEKEPTRFLILRRDGKGKPITIEQPANMVFHHGNAFEHDGKIVVDSFLSPDGSILDLLYSWSKDRLPEINAARATRLTLDPASGKVESRTEMAQSQEFPRFDIRRSGQDARYLYALENTVADDPLAFNLLVRHDLHKGGSKRVEAEKGRALGEAVFVPHPGKEAEDRGWILLQGYDGNRDENYLEIRDAGTMDFEARVWTGQHFPLGFHGNFSAGSFVSV